MSKIRHDSPEAEKLALFWHRLGVVLNGGAMVVNLFGVFWHLWAARQHKKVVNSGE